MRRYMFGDLGVSLFDVAMLDRTRKADSISKQGVVPFCPMLSQGWYYLRPRGMKMPRVLEGAQDELVQALWTTFNRKHMRLDHKCGTQRDAHMNLLLIHGRSQGGKNQVNLQAEWLEALDKGLKKSKLNMPAGVCIQFPFYADVLDGSSPNSTCRRAATSLPRAERWITTMPSSGRKWRRRCGRGPE